MIVTATRTPQNLDDTVAPVTSISRSDIEKSGAKSVTELLSGMPGVETASNGAYGQPSSIFLRGTNSNHVLTMVDGVRVGSATVGTTAFHLIPVEQIDRKTKDLVADMIATLQDANGLGLAAPQVGVSKRIFIADLSAIDLAETLRVFLKCGSPAVDCRSFNNTKSELVM